MRVGILKPDFHITGGFELVLSHITSVLEERGHQVGWEEVEAAHPARTARGLAIPDPIWSELPELFRYLTVVEGFERLDLSRWDLVISTQPPSLHGRHPRHLALFFHHHRPYYDLSDVYVEAGFVDPALHARAERGIRAVDAPAFAAVTGWCAGSEVVAERLAAFNGIRSGVGIYHAMTSLLATSAPDPAGDPFEHVLCVSRHEFPKRTELMVSAMKHLPRRTGMLVGTGGRLPFVEQVDARLSRPGVDLDAVDARSLWCNTGVASAVEPASAGSRSNVTMAGQVSVDDLSRLYRGALCVVAPALQEDYGLTALEAMAHAKPLVVCRDGGGLVDFVVDGETGFVVEPTGAAIGAALQCLVEDPELARKMGAAALERSRRFTWDRAKTEFLETFDRVADA